MKVRRVLGGAFVLVVAAFLVPWLLYRYDLTTETLGLQAGSVVARTPCGPIEYADDGTGPAVLFVHGAGGGYSQGSAYTRALAAGGFRAIAMSRFGYLRTPLPEDPNPEKQADAHACLLDALGIERAAIVGVSAGAPSSLQFCIRHADRCTALVLLVPATHVPQRTREWTTPPSPWMDFVLGTVLESDFVIWTLTRVRPEILVETALATPLEVYRAASADERDRAVAMARDIFPVSLRVDGLRNDARICADLPRYALEDIRAPTLAISVEDDLYDTYAGARYTVEQVRGARLVAYPTGGHVWLGHDAHVREEILGFLRTHGATARGTTRQDPRS